MQRRDKNRKLSKEITLFKLQLKLSETISFAKQHFSWGEMPVEWGLEWVSRLMVFWEIISSCLYEQRSICQTFPGPEQTRVKVINLRDALTKAEVDNAVLKPGVKWNKENLLYKLGGPRLLLLVSPFVVAASINVPDSLGVIKDNEKPFLPILSLSLCLVLHSPLKFCRASEVNKPLLILRYSMLGVGGGGAEEVGWG